MKIVLKGHITIPDADIECVKRALPRHIELTRRETGCLRFEVIPHQGDDHRYDVYEEFTDRAAFDAHQQRARESEWGRVTRNVERNYRIEEVS